MPLRLVDLHVHSTASDGSDSPAQLVRKAVEESLAALAVTDHDTLAGLDEAAAEARCLNLGLGFELVRGCEISTREAGPEGEEAAGKGGEIHLLGLWLPPDGPGLAGLERFLLHIRESRERRNLLMLDNMRALGFDVLPADLARIAGPGVAGRPHFAALLKERGAVKSHAEAFRVYLRPGGKIYVPRELVTPEAGVVALAACTRCVCLAHPCLSLRGPEEIEALVKRLIPCGLTGIEAYHSEHSAGDTRYLVDLAARYGLLLTGGSDYHGSTKPKIRLARGKGQLRVTEAVVDKWKDFLARG